MNWLADPKTGRIHGRVLLVMAMVTFVCSFVVVRWALPMAAKDEARGAVRATTNILLVPLALGHCLIYGLWYLSEWAKERKYQKCKVIAEGISYISAIDLMADLKEKFGADADGLKATEWMESGRWTVFTQGNSEPVLRMQEFARGWLSK